MYSWQWVEFDEPDYYGNRLTVNLSWSPPPAHYCVGSKMGIIFKLTNKTRNDKNSNVVAELSWGPSNTKGKGRKRVTIKGNESGKTVESTAIMSTGPISANSNEANVWYATVSAGKMIGKINYYYAPVESKGQMAQKKQHSTPQQKKSTEGATAVANLNAHNEAFVRSLYYAILDRRPDEGGVRNWTQWLDKGKSRAWVITEFFNSSEYRSRQKNNTEYVRDLYQGVLGRQPDSGGLSNWVNHLNSGKSRQFVLNGFLNSQEYRSKAKG